ncbi:MAG: cation:proton antiporter [Actinobacteria bacterium]|nr:cation:proton antiporter [Actinomycetota bacterium]
MELTLTGLFYVFVAATLAPVALSLVPWLPLPGVVLEILLGVALGPLALGLVDPGDEVISVLALLGVSMLLFFAGLELDLRAIVNPRIVRLALAYVLSLALALLVGTALSVAGVDLSPLFLMVLLTATGLGVLLPIMKDAGYLDTELGQVIFGACAIAEVIPLVLLSTLFPPADSTVLQQAGKIVILIIVAAVAAFVILRSSDNPSISGRLQRLEDTTAQLRVRATFLILLGLAALATRFEIEVIFAALAAGLVVGASRKDALAHTVQLKKLEGAAFGIFIPVFFVSTGINLDLSLLDDSLEAALLVPILLLALLLVRGLPVVLYRGLMTPRESLGTGLFQATSLSLLIAAAPVGLAAGAITESTSTALITAGMLSVILYPALGKAVLGRGDNELVDGRHTPAGQDQPV